MKHLNAICEPLLEWYAAHRRDLPWRHTDDPYRIWISEVMLQQTRVEAVKDYYARFLRELPDVRSLAECPHDRLMKLWEGLGYYSRARNLQAAARTVMEEYGGAMPRTFSELKKLKGIGDYTARAIASIAFGEAQAVVDGNVLRVYTRLTAWDADIALPATRAAVQEALNAVIPADNAGDFNQAMMELGATVCVPNGPPLCLCCPLSRFCEAHSRLEETKYPVKSFKAARKSYEMTVFVLRQNDAVILRKRPASGLLAGLYEFPHVDGRLAPETAQSALAALTGAEAVLSPLGAAKHIFTHLEWHMVGYGARLPEDLPLSEGLIAVPLDRVGKAYSIPSAFRAYTRTLNLKD